MVDSEKEKFLTVEDVAEILRVSPKTVRDMINNKSLKAFRVAKARWRIKKADLDSYIASRYKQQG